MESVLAIFAAAFGALLMSWSVFLYPHEERSIGDTLAAWWIRINDAGTSAIARNRVLIRDVAAALAHWLDSVFGERLLSIRAIAVSICLSFSSALAYMGIAALIDPAPGSWNPKIVAVCLPLSYCCFAVAVGRRRRLLNGVSFTLVGGVVTLTIVGLAVNPLPSHALIFLEAALVAVTCDFLVILLARRLVTIVSSVSIAIAFAIGIISALLGVAMLGAPALVIYNNGIDWDIWAALGFSAGMTNLYAGIVAVALAALNTVFLLQRALWSVIERPLYAIDRFGLFQKRKTLFYCGALLVAFGFPRLANTLLKALNLFKGQTPPNCPHKLKKTAGPLARRRAASVGSNCTRASRRLQFTPTAAR